MICGKSLELTQLDAMGYRRRSLRLRGRESIVAMTPQDGVELACLWSDNRRRAVRERLRRRRADITDAAIRDLLFKHAMRDSEREREIAARCMRRRQGG